MALFTVPELEGYVPLLRSCAPGQHGIGDLSELLKKIPFWIIAWGVDLQIDPNATPLLAKPFSKELRKWLKVNRSNVAQFGERVAKSFRDFPSVNILPEDQPLDSEGRDKTLCALILFRDLGRAGIHAVVIIGFLLKFLGSAVQAAPKDAAPSNTASFYAVRSVAVTCVFWMIAQIDALLGDSALSIRDDASRSSIFSGAKMLCEYVTMGRKALEKSSGFRSPELGPVHYFGITARNWHEVAIR
jgi:hypothetical protein